MAAYRDVLMAALADHAPEIDATCISMGVPPAVRRWRQRWHTLTMPFAARRQPTPDVWHILDGSRAYLAIGLRRAPVVITAHDVIPVLQAAGAFPGAPPVGPAARWLWRANAAAMRRAARVVSDSVSTAKDLGRAFGIPAADLPVIGLPVRPSLAQYAISPATGARDPWRLLHVGNNSFYKWREQALRIFARLPSGYRLSLIGPPPMAELRQLATALGIEDRIEFVDEPPDAQLADYYRRARLLIFPSRYEGFGWPVLEAMSFGLPVVASNRGSLPEVVGAAAETFDPENIDGFVAAARALLEDPTAWQQASVRALKQAECFALRGFARKMVEQYRVAAETQK
jgi:glycosyltransferase involved in cell wall biosynthesis